VDSLIERLERVICEGAGDDDLIAFNTALAKKLRGLKRDVGAKTFNQGYKGTGGQKHRRQIWIGWADGSVVDVWLDSGFFRFGGITSQLAGRDVQVNPRSIVYDEKSVDAVYREVAAALKSWRKPAEKAVQKPAAAATASHSVAKKSSTYAEMARAIPSMKVGDELEVVYRQYGGSPNKKQKLRVVEAPYGDSGATMVSVATGRKTALGRPGTITLDKRNKRVEINASASKPPTELVSLLHIQGPAELPSMRAHG